MKEWFFQNYEHIYNAIKFLGFIRGFEISIHFIIVNLFFRKIGGGIYKFSNFTFKYNDSDSLIEIFSGIFTSNPYYFVANKNNPVIIDVGANIGDTLLYFKYLYPDSAVVCFEPHPEAYKLLTENISRNHFKNVKTFQVGLGDHDGSLTLYSSDFGNYRTASNSKDWASTALLNVDPKGLTVKSYKVKVEKLSARLKHLELSRIDLLKIDAEGAEFSILNDLNTKNMLKPIRKIILEYHPLTDKIDNPFDKIFSILLQSGFKMSVFNYYRSIYNKPIEKAFMIVAENINSHEH